MLSTVGRSRCNWENSSPNVDDVNGNLVGRRKESATDPNQCAIYAPKIVNIVNYMIDIIDLYTGTTIAVCASVYT